MAERYQCEGLFGRTWHGGDWNNAISREMRDLQAVNRGLKGKLAESERQNERLRGTVDALHGAACESEVIIGLARRWTIFGASPCPFCDYREGVYHGPCNYHAEINRLTRLLTPRLADFPRIEVDAALAPGVVEFRDAEGFVRGRIVNIGPQDEVNIGPQDEVNIGPQDEVNIGPQDKPGGAWRREGPYLRAGGPQDEHAVAGPEFGVGGEGEGL